MFTERIGDMDPKSRLRIYRDAEGDIIVQVLQFGPQGLTGVAEVEFCTIGMDKGRSAETFDALLKLIEAMAQDNEKGKYPPMSSFDPPWPNGPE